MPIDSLQAATCGQILTGLPRSVFARSVFLAQEAHALTYDEALEQQLQRLVSTGPQEATFAQAKQQLQQLVMSSKTLKKLTVFVTSLAK